MRFPVRSPACPLWLWRAGLPRVGLRSSPNTAECGVSDIAGVVGFGAAAQPNAGQARSPQGLQRYVKQVVGLSHFDWRCVR